MENLKKAGNTPFGIIDSDVGGRGDPEAVEEYAMFQSSHQEQMEPPLYSSPKKPESNEGLGSTFGRYEIQDTYTHVSSRREEALALGLNEDQRVVNPFQSNSQQITPLSQSVHPEVQHMEAAYDEVSSPLAQTKENLGQPSQGANTSPTSHPPLRASETLSAVAAKGRHTLRRATTSVKEGVKCATVRVAHAGEQVGRVWSKTLDSAMTVCVLCGALAIVLLAIAVSLRAWRFQHLEFSDDNGENLTRVDLGLETMQRIQRLTRTQKAGYVYIYDPPLLYQDALTSAYCADGPVEQPLEAREGGRGAPPVALQSLSSVPPAAPEPENAVAREAAPRALSVGFMPRWLQPAPAATAANAEAAQRRGPLENPPPFSVTVGRDPAVPGGLSPNYSEMRAVLLGPTIFDLNCKDLESYKTNGLVFVRLAVAYFVFAGLGMVGALFSILGAPSSAAASCRMKQMPVNVLGTLGWLVALVLQLAGLASWGIGTDVAACVTSEGGASVCRLGPAMSLAIGSLVLTLVSTLCFAAVFTHTHIRLLWGEKQQEPALRQQEQQHRNTSKQDIYSPQQPPTSSQTLNPKPSKPLSL